MPPPGGSACYNTLLCIAEVGTTHFYSNLASELSPLIPTTVTIETGKYPVFSEYKNKFPS